MLGTGDKNEFMDNVQRFFGPESLDGLRRMIVELSRKSSAARSEGVNVRLDGEKIWVDVHAHPVPGSEDDWSQVIVSTSDLTVRKNAELALAESDQRHRDILGAMTDALVITDMEGKVRSTNRTALSMYGYGQEEFEGIDFSSLLVAEDRAKFAEVKAAVARGEQFACETKDLRRDGSSFYSELKATSIVFGSQPFILLLIRDVTERKQAEAVRAGLQEQLRRAQKLEAIGTLAGGVAHDFNNLLAAIMGYAELILLKLSADSQQHEYVVRILKAGERARGVVQQILSFSRQTEVEKQLVDLRPVFREAMRLLRATIPTTIEIVERFSSEPVVVFADHTQMHQVLMNLATNAYHAIGPEGGRLEIFLDQSQARKGFVEIRVTDTGHGIAPEILQRIFDPYFTTKEVGQGSGMGLAVVQGIVAEHGGEIDVKSTPGDGSVFTVYLPSSKGKPAMAREEEREDGGLPWGDERIMVIDDESAIVELIQIALGQFGYKVSAFTSPVKALEKFMEDPYGTDLVVSDQTMPGMVGTELAKRMLAVRKDLPIIVCTGHSETLNLENAHLHGIADFYMKPVKAAELARAIRKLLTK